MQRCFSSWTARGVAALAIVLVALAIALPLGLVLRKAPPPASPATSPAANAAELSSVAEAAQQSPPSSSLERRTLPAQPPPSGAADLSRWMTNSKLRSTPFNQLWIPGTHDSATFDLVRKTYPDSCDSPLFASLGSNPGAEGDIVFKLSVTQLSDFVGQVKLGSRYFDLRLYRNSSGVVLLEHCLVTAQPLMVYMTALRDWLAGSGMAGAQELLLLHVKSFRGTWDTAAHAALLNDLSNLFGDAVVKTPTPGATLAAMFGSQPATPSSRPKVILAYGDSSALAATSNSLKCPSCFADAATFISRPYTPAGTNDDLYARNLRYLQQRPSVASTFVLECILTANVTQVLDLLGDAAANAAPYLLPRLMGCYQGSSTPCLNNQLQTWLSGAWATAVPSIKAQGMIVMADFLGTHNPGLAQSIVQLNSALAAGQ